MMGIIIGVGMILAAGFGYLIGDLTVSGFLMTAALGFGLALGILLTKTGID